MLRTMADGYKVQAMAGNRLTAWALLALMAAGGLFGGRVAQARALESPAAVPVVDKLAVRVVTDSYHHAFEPGRTTAGVQVQRHGFSVSPRTPPPPPRPQKASPRTRPNPRGGS